jgi:hypothetical protein
VNRELAAILDRARSNATHREELQRELAAPRSPLLRFGGREYFAGDRVFDRVSGQEGEIVAGTTENIIVPNS